MAISVHYPMFWFLKTTNFVGSTFSNIMSNKMPPHSSCEHCELSI